MVPHQPGALVVGIVIRRLTGHQDVGGIKNAAGTVHEACPGAIITRRKPVEGAAVADPRHQSAMQVDGGAVLERPAVCPRDGNVHRERVNLPPGISDCGQFVGEGYLNGRALLGHDDTAQVLWGRVVAAAQSFGGIVTPEDGAPGNDDGNNLSVNC